MTRQQRFKKLCAELDRANSDTESTDSYQKYARAMRRLAWYVFSHADKITVASDPPKAKRHAKH